MSHLDTQRANYFSETSMFLKPLCGAAVCSTVLLGLSPAFGQSATLNVTTATGDVAFGASGQTASLDCGGQGAAIMGSNNILTIKGSCRNLAVTGSNNKIEVELANDSNVAFVGSDNVVSYRTPKGTKPIMSSVGANNSIAAAR